MSYKSMWYMISETFIKNDTANSGVSGRPDARWLHAVQVNVAHDRPDARWLHAVQVNVAHISQTFIKHDTANSSVSGKPDARRLHAVQVNVVRDLTDIRQARHSKQRREWQT